MNDSVPHGLGGKFLVHPIGSTVCVCVGGGVLARKYVLGADFEGSMLPIIPCSLSLPPD